MDECDVDGGGDDDDGGGGGGGGGGEVLVRWLLDHEFVVLSYL